MMAKALARLARAVLGAGAGRMRNRMLTCMSLARPLVNSYVPKVFFLGSDLEPEL